MSHVLGFQLQRYALHKQIADQIQRLVISKALRPGDKLPSERELAEELGVSRPVVREAVRTLTAQGLVTVRPGSGTYVRAPTPEDAAAPIEILLRLGQAPESLTDLGYLKNLYEVRRTLETDVAGFAAQRATQEDITVMQDVLEAMAEDVSDPEPFAEHDRDFHMALAAAAHNGLYTVLLTPISGLLIMLGNSFETAPTIETSFQRHCQILDRVTARDAEGARKAMLEHLDESERMLAVTLERLEAGSDDPLERS
jgi:DNA-binding FadR family transcriptional regulator